MLRKIQEICDLLTDNYKESYKFYSKIVGCEDILVAQLIVKYLKKPDIYDIIITASTKCPTENDAYYNLLNKLMLGCETCQPVKLFFNTSYLCIERVHIKIPSFVSLEDLQLKLTIQNGIFLENTCERI